MQMISPTNALTPRQLEFLALYASGYDIRQIAAVKFVHYNVAQRTLSDARERVGAKSLGHLCAVAVDTGAIVKNGVGYKPVTDERVIGE